MVTMFKPSAKEKFIEHAMEYHKINREDAKKLVRALEMIEEVKLTRRIDEVFKVKEEPNSSSSKKTEKA